MSEEAPRDLGKGPLVIKLFPNEAQGIIDKINSLGPNPNMHIDPSQAQEGFFSYTFTGDRRDIWQYLQNPSSPSPQDISQPPQQLGQEKNKKTQKNP